MAEDKEEEGRKTELKSMALEVIELEEEEEEEEVDEWSVPPT